MQAKAKIINHGIMLNISTETFTHNRILRADNTFLTSKDYKFVNFLSVIASNPISAKQSLRTVSMRNTVTWRISILMTSRKTKINAY